ncbi:MAG TPA: LppP/LprE family lipoprotein [Conexibacter sp.]|nr:LppP/LprE family lipoprotein [Conexibacter sp.]
MPSRRRTLSALAPAALALLALAGCGGGARTAAHVATRTVTRTVTTPNATTQATTSATATSTAPAAPPNPNATLSLHAAEQALTARGYATLSERDWRPDQPLKVLIGVGLRSPAGVRRELAFFFVGATFIGTDTKDPSGQIAVLAQDGGGATLSYGLYRPSDSIDAPTGGTAAVTYRWTGTRLIPQDPIPSAAPAASPSRR